MIFTTGTSQKLLFVGLMLVYYYPRMVVVGGSKK